MWTATDVLILLIAQAATPEIVVTGRGLPERPADRVANVVTIERARIAEVPRLETLLADVAGLQQFRRSDSRSANPTSQGITLRGIGGNAASRALLILDGVPQADPFGGWVAFPAYATERLGTVRVTRGGGSGYFGPGALAGTIELESRTNDALAPLEGAASYGTRRTIDIQGSTSLVRPHGFATVSGAYARSDGFIPTIAADRGPADRRAPYIQASGAVRGVLMIDEATEFQAALAAFGDRRERGTAFSGNRSRGADASARLVGRGQWEWSALLYLQTRDFASRFASVDAARATATETLNQYSTPATGLGARLELAPPLGSAVSLRVGGDARRVSGRSQELYSFAAGVPTRRREAGGTNDTLGLFADGSAEAGTLTFALSGRADWWRIADGSLIERPLAGGAALSDSRFATRKGVETTGRVGAAWQAVPHVTLRASAYRGWRLPTLNELYRPFRVGADATAADATLRPERLTGAEGGISVAPSDGLSLAANVFWSRLDNAIANVSLAQGPGIFPGVGFVAGTYRARRNLDAIRAAGVELDASWRQGPVDARLSWSHSDARVRAPGQALHGLRPAQTPRDQLSATLGWRAVPFHASLTLRHSSEQFEDDANSRSLAAATTLDIFAAMPLSQALRLEARAENLFDTRVEAAISASGTIERALPRTVSIGLAYRPN